MARRGRRQVLQLDDVSSSHSPRPRGFAPAQKEEVERKLTSNPLLSLVGYSSDASSDDDSDNDKVEEKTLPNTEVKENTSGAGGKESVLEIPLPAEAEPLRGPEPQEGVELFKPPDQQKTSESSRVSESVQQTEPPAVESMKDIPLPESSGPAQNSELNSTIDSEVANFLAEIESISAENAPPDKDDGDLPTTSDPPTTNNLLAVANISKSPEPDLGFIPRADASVSLATEEKKVASKVEEKNRGASVSSAYQTMFVKGAAEFVRTEREEEKMENGVEIDEELPEEPVSEWQVVQDDATQYYYYWNMVTNEVTWEIPPGYTQFLLLYKEYQERIAAIPKDKLLLMKEKKKQSSTAGRESSPAPSASKSKKEKKHKRDKHRKETSEAASSLPAVQIGPQLPPMPSEDSSSEVKIVADQSEAETVGEVRNVVSPKPSSEEGKAGKICEGLESAVESTSMGVPQDVEAIFDEALSVVSESHGDAAKDDTAVVTQRDDSTVSGDATVPVVASSSVVETSSLVPSMDVTTSAASVDSLKSSVDSSKSVSAESSKSGSPAPVENDLATVPSAAVASTSVVSSSSVASSVSLASKDIRDGRVDSGEGVVTNSGVSDNVAPEEEDDDLDVDFDDIDNLDRALEEALKKKKAELEKLENKFEEDAIMTDTHPAHPSQSRTSEQMSGASPTEPESAVSSSVKTTSEHSPTAASSSKSSSATGDRDAPDSSETKLKPSRPKRLAAESSTKDEDFQSQETVAKKARLVAYDAVETDEESMDATEDVSTSPAELVKTSGEANSLAEVLPTPPPEPVDNLAEIEEMANTACAKLAFLDVTVEGLSPLQTSLIALQTRMMDWQNGGLNGEYFFQRLKEVNDLLMHYESRAVPPGWTCQWDSNFRRYFYINGTTGETQWEYPEMPSEDAPKREEHRSKSGKSSRKRKSKVVGPEPLNSKTALTEDSEAAAVSQNGPATCQESTAACRDGVVEDLDGVAMSKEEEQSSNLQQANGESNDNQPSTSTGSSAQGEGIPSALQALFPGEPLPPGTELLLGLPPPPPPPLPPDEAATTSTTEDAYVCADDSSDEGSEKAEERGRDNAEEVADMPNLDPDIDGEEMVEEEEEEGEVMMDRKEAEEEEEEAVPAMVMEDPAVISKPPQLRFPPAAMTSAMAQVSSSSSAGQISGMESSLTISSQPVLGAAPILNMASSQPLPDSASSSIAASGSVTSPKVEERHRSSRSPVPIHEPSSSSRGVEHQKHDKPEKHKKKKKEKLGSHTVSMKKKGVEKMVKNWQKVQEQREKDDRAMQQRQLAIRQQLDEWKKGNS